MTRSTATSAARLTTAGALVVGLVMGSGCSLLPGEAAEAPSTPEVAAAAPSPAVDPSPVVDPGPSPEPSPTTRSWSELFDETSGGVVRIASVTCDSGGSGSGFLVGPGVVATAAHVVQDASSLSVRFGPDVFSGDVVLASDEDDLALVEIDGTPGAHRFEPAETAAGVGEDVAVMGYPLGRPIAMTQGAVTSVDLRADVEGRDRRGLFMTDSAINPGNSGGPVIGSDGTVVGVVVAGGDGPGAGLAAGLPALRALLKRYEAGERDDTPPAECFTEETDPFTIPVGVTVSSDHPEAPSIAQAMQLYAQSINSGYYDLVWQLLTPTMRERNGSLEEYAEGLQSSYWLSLDVQDVEALDDRTDEARVAFRTVQDAEFGPSGQTCSDWVVTYTLALDEGFWQIDGARLDDGPPQACDETLPVP